MVFLVFKVCGILFMMNYGNVLYVELIKVGVDCDVMVGIFLVGMYVKCGGIINVCKVFDFML